MSVDSALLHLGQFFFSKKRSFFFFFLLIMPILIVASFLLIKSCELNTLQDRFASYILKEKKALVRKAKKERFLYRLSQVDPYFVETQLASFPFLQEEKEELESLLKHPVLPNHKMLKERLQFLSHNNTLQFSEEKEQKNSTVKEFELKQKKSIQMNEENLQSVLALIETAPTLLIQKMTIKKQKTPLQTEVFEVEMDLLKREFLK